MNAHQIKIWFACGLGILISLFFAVLIGGGEVESVIVFLSGFVILIWMAFGTRIWWLPVPFLSALGGVFQGSFKVQPVEVGLLVAFLAAIPMIVTKNYGIAASRPSLPFSVKAFFVYLGLHLIGSLLYNQYIGLGGWGNTLRAYMSFLWPVFFIILFYFYGDSRQLSLGFWAIFIAGALRLLMGLFVQISGQSIEVPGIGYVGPSFGDLGESGIVIDLRASGYLMIGMSLMAFVLVKNYFGKIFLGAFFLLAIAGVLFGGGRAGFMVSVILGFCFLVLYRKWSLILASFAAFVALAALVNISPGMLNPLPYGAQRVAQTLIFADGNRSEAAGDAAGSDEYSVRLRNLGWKNWTESPWTIVFGQGMRTYQSLPPSAAYNGSLMFEAAIDNAAKVGAYESGLWTVLAVVGLAGALFFLNIFRYFIGAYFKDLWTYKITNYGRAFAFFGVASLAAWLAACYRSQGVPVYVLFYSFLGWVAWIDSKQIERLRSRNQPRERSLAASLKEA